MDTSCFLFHWALEMRQQVVSSRQLSGVLLWVLPRCFNLVSLFLEVTSYKSGIFQYCWSVCESDFWEDTGSRRAIYWCHQNMVPMICFPDIQATCHLLWNVRHQLSGIALRLVPLRKSLVMVSIPLMLCLQSCVSVSLKWNENQGTCRAV